jgi:hypothetical protein
MLGKRKAVRIPRQGRSVKESQPYRLNIAANFMLPNWIPPMPVIQSEEYDRKYVYFKSKRCAHKGILRKIM